MQEVNKPMEPDTSAQLLTSFHISTKLSRFTTPRDQTTSFSKSSTSLTHSISPNISKEALRLRPAGVIATRQSIQDVQVGPYFIPKDVSRSAAYYWI